VPILVLNQGAEMPIPVRAQLTNASAGNVL
jgi:hypothetical protein